MPSPLKFLLIPLALLIYILLLPPFLLLFLIPFYIYRIFIQALAKYKRPDLIEIVSPRDALVGLDDVTKKCQCVLSIMLTLKGDLEVDRVKSVWEDKVIQSGEYGKFEWYPEDFGGYAFWKQEEHFNLDEHIRVYECDNNNGLNEQELMELLGRLSTQVFPERRSPWEILLIPTYFPPQNPEIPHVVLLFRIHHAICDGYSIMRLILTQLCNEPHPVPKIKPQSTLESIRNTLGIIVLSPYYQLKQFFVDIDRNFWHMGRNELSGDWWTIRCPPTSFATIKKTSNTLDISTTALLLTVFGQGIRRYLCETKTKDIPKIMRALSPMPWKTHPFKGLVNHWTLGPMVLPVGEVENKFKIANDSIKNLKTSPILFANFFTVPILFTPPNCVTDWVGTNWMTTMVLSNFAGPNYAVKMFDREGLDVSFWLPQMRGTCGIGVAFLSYNQTIRVTATIDKKIIPTKEGAELLSKCIEMELNNCGVEQCDV